MIWFIILLWYVIGVGSFIFWWTSDFDFEGSDVPTAAIAGIAGPFIFVLGFFIHGFKRVIIKQRKKD